jgi:uncharacterized protein YaaN involved in tellurite resistance
MLCLVQDCVQWHTLYLHNSNYYSKLDEQIIMGSALNSVQAAMTGALMHSLENGNEHVGGLQRCQHCFKVLL